MRRTAITRKTPLRSKPPKGYEKRERVLPPVPANPQKPRATMVLRINDGKARMSVSVPKRPSVKSEQYRRLVAALPCISCGRHNRSQAAHPNTGKAAGRKLIDDRLCFPLCCGDGTFIGCHERFDQGAMFTKEDRRLIEPKWTRDTVQYIVGAGLWPKSLPMLELQP